MSDDAIKDSIEQAATDGIQSATGEGGSVTKMSIDEQIKANRYLKSQAAANRNGFGLRRTKLIPPGAG